MWYMLYLRYGIYLYHVSPYLLRYLFYVECGPYSDYVLGLSEIKVGRNKVPHKISD